MSGPMTWIKVHVSLIMDDKFRMLSEHDRFSWVMLMVMAGSTQGVLRYNSGYLQGVLRIRKPINLRLFEDIGLIEKIRLDREEKIEKKEESNIHEKPDFVPKLIEIWNQHSKSKVKGFFPKRLDLLVSRWKEVPDFEYWTGIFKAANQSAFLAGTEKKKWKLTLEWVMEHHVEILEGKYSDESKQAGLIPTMQLR